MSELNKPARGGKRAGAGRPSQGKKMKSLRLSPDVVALVEAQPDQTAYVENAVRFYHETGGVL